MSVKSLLRQSMTVYGQTSYNAEGREVVGAGTSVQCRFQETTKQKIAPNGSVISLDAIAYVPEDTTVAEDDHVEYNGTRYKVVGLYATPNGIGEVEFIKLELTQWPQT